MPLLRILVLTDSAANLLERVARRQALYRGAEPRVDGVESFHFTRPVDKPREAERPLHDEGRISRMVPQRLDFVREFGRLLLQQLGVRAQLFEAQTSRVAARSTKPLEGRYPS